MREERLRELDVFTLGGTAKILFMLRVQGQRDSINIPPYHWHLKKTGSKMIKRHDALIHLPAL